MNILVARRWIQDFLVWPQRRKGSLRSLDLPPAAKKNVPWKWGVGAVWNSWLQADLFFSERGGGVNSVPIFYINIYNLYF